MLHSGAFQLDQLIFLQSHILQLVKFDVLINLNSRDFFTFCSLSASRLVFARLVTDTAKRSSYLNKKNTLKIRQRYKSCFEKQFLGLWTYFTAFSSIRRTLLARSPTWNGLELDMYSTFWVLSGVEETRTVVRDKFCYVSITIILLLRTVVIWKSWGGEAQY